MLRTLQILLPSSIVPLKKYGYSTYGHGKNMNHCATIALLHYITGASTTTDYFSNPDTVVLGKNERENLQINYFDKLKQFIVLIHLKFDSILL
jgi:hypothetical protein